MDIPINTVMSFCNAFWAMLIQSKDAESVAYAYEALEKSGANVSAIQTIVRSRLEEFGNSEVIANLLNKGKEV